MKIKYVKGDATYPEGPAEQVKIIAHVCNDLGRWGAGFSGAISKRWKIPEACYRQYIASDEGRSKLGAIQVLSVALQERISVANMIAQKGIRSRDNPVPLQYSELEGCLKALNCHIYKYYDLPNDEVVVHMPKIGAGLAGGDWHTIEHLIERTICAAAIPVVVYELP